MCGICHLQVSSERGIDRYVSGVWEGIIYVLTPQGEYPFSRDSRRERYVFNGIRDKFGVDWSTSIWVRDLTVPMHLGLNKRSLYAPYQFMGALLLCSSSRWPPELYSWCPLIPRNRRPDAHVWVTPKLHTHKECGPRFIPLLHTSYTVDCHAALVGEDVSSGYYVQWEGQ